MWIWADLVMALSNLISLKTAETQKQITQQFNRKCLKTKKKEKNLRQKKNKSIMCYYPWELNITH